MVLSSVITVFVAGALVIQITGQSRHWQTMDIRDITSPSGEKVGRSFVRQIIYNPQINMNKATEEYTVKRTCKCEDMLQQPPDDEEETEDQNPPAPTEAPAPPPADEEPPPPAEGGKPEKEPPAGGRACTVEKHISSYEKDEGSPQKYASSYEKKTVPC